MIALRHITIVLCSLPVMLFSMDRAEAEALVEQANTAYSAGDHELALALYDSVSAAYTSTALLYNIGNCHFKLGDVPHAILFYERALRHAPGAEDVQANLDLARQQVVDRVSALPSFSLGNTWSRIRGGRDADQWARRALWACTGLFALLALALLLRAKALRRTCYAAAGAALLFTLLAVGLAAARYLEVTADDEAIIMTAKVDVRSEPHDGGTVLFVLHKGTKVEVLKDTDGWNEVRLPNGSVGWMPATGMVRI